MTQPDTVAPGPANPDVSAPQHGRPIAPDQLRAVRSLHDEFAAGAGAALSALLRSPVEARVTEVLQQSYGDFSVALPAGAYVGVVRVQPFGLPVAMQLDLSLALPLVEMLLGGGGEGHSQRDLTEIEEHLLGGAMEKLAAQLQKTWPPSLGCGFRFERRQPNDELRRLMAPHEKLLVVVLEMKIQDARGELRLGFPALVANALLRKLAEAWSYPRARQETDTRPRMRQRMREARFAVELVLPPAPVRMRQLLELREGEVLNLRQPADRAAQLRVAGTVHFEAQAIRQGARRAALLQSAPIAPKSDIGDML